MVLTFYFTESGQINYRGKQYKGFVTAAEIEFVNDQGARFTVSRILGRLATHMPEGVVR